MLALLRASCLAGKVVLKRAEQPTFGLGFLANGVALGRVAIKGLLCQIGRVVSLWFKLYAKRLRIC